MDSPPTPAGNDILWGVRLLSLLIRGYQGLSRLGGPRCRFYPSCSKYMHNALSLHGLWKGLGLGLVRILKCHPWHPGGVDFVKVPHGQ